MPTVCATVFFFADTAAPLELKREKNSKTAKHARKTTPAKERGKTSYDDLYTVWRFDYGSGSGTGSVATIETSRFIADTPKNFLALRKAIWESMKKDPRYRGITRDSSNFFNHTTVLIYRGHNKLPTHADQVWTPDGKFESSRNSQKKGSAVVTVTIGDDRILRFVRRSANGNNWNKEEKKEFMTVTHKHMKAYVLHPEDEKPLLRHDGNGTSKARLQYLHYVERPPRHDQEDYLSIAIIFRCVTKCSPVSVCDNRMTVDDRTIKRFDTKEVKERIAKRARKQEKAMNDERSQENATIAEYNAFLKRRCREIFG